MALVNHAKREINAKIVYYGHEGVGKRASLQYVYDRIKPSLRGELKSQSTGGSTLLFFDFSPFDKPVFGGYRVRFHMYSLTGKVANPAAWKMTLKGADGLVIVADAAPEKLPAGRENISLLRDFLGAYGAGLHDIPCVLQLNRTGNEPQENATVTAADLGVPDMPACFSKTTSGEGVLETLSQLSREIVTRIAQSDALRKPACDEASCGDGESGITGVDALPDSDALLNQPDSSRSLNALSDMDPGISGKTPEVLQVSLTGSGAEIVDGVVRVPLEIAVGGAIRRLVVSIAVDPV